MNILKSFTHQSITHSMILYLTLTLRELYARQPLREKKTLIFNQSLNKPFAPFRCFAEP
jgi:hypothetical protein